MKLDRKIAIVTGASRGIGRAIAVKLAAEGASIVLTARDAALLQQAAGEIQSAGGNAATLALDLRERENPARLAKFAIERFGGIDIVVNNAGATKRGEFADLTDADWDDGFALKFFGAVRLTRAAWPHLRAASGSVIFISGVGGRTPGAQFAVGGSVNAALLSLTKALAEAGIRDGIQVNCVSPGTIRTARFQTRLDAFAASRNLGAAEAEREFMREHSIARIGEPEDIAALVAFIARPEGRLLHGSLIDMDAGATKTV